MPIHGVWKKYDAQPNNWNNKHASYQKLYEDLKDTGVDWSIASSLYECEKRLCGEMIPCDGTVPGDIYVYYINEKGSMSPVFYIRIYEFKDIDTKQRANQIYFNDCSLGCDGIDNKYLPQLISKLRELDEEKNKHFIERLENRYKEYQRLLSLQEKAVYEQEELVFLYYMAYKVGDEIALSKVEKRDIQEDYESLNDENKVKLFLNIKNSEVCDKLSIISRDILIAIAQNKCLKQLRNASEDIINDKEYIMNLLGSFYKLAQSRIYYHEFEMNLPSIYQVDIDILQQYFYMCTTVGSFEIAKWLEAHSSEIESDSQFLYKLIDSFTRSLINIGEPYYENFLLYPFNESLLYDIEHHVLFGPEPNKQREELKDISAIKLQENKQKILEHKLARNS